MMYTENYQDLFELSDDEWYLAHCISGDYALGAGIAKTFNDKYQMREQLHDLYPLQPWEKYANVGKALLVDRVFNLVTKPRYFQKPTYESLQTTLNDLLAQCMALNVRFLALPRIGCGLDKLDWKRVSRMIFDTFKDTDVRIMVCLGKK